MKTFLKFIDNIYDETWQMFLKASRKGKFLLISLVVLELIVPIIGVMMGMNHILALIIAFFGVIDLSIFIEKIFFN